MVMGGAAGDACGGLCGGVGGLCCEAEGLGTSTQWQFVGEGNGSFIVLPTYNYVGPGAGSFEMQEVMAAYGWKWRACCMPLAFLLLLAGFIIVPLMPGVNTDTTTLSQFVIVTPAPLSAAEVVVAPFSAPEVVVTTTLPNCMTKEVWSTTKKQYCCQVLGVGCPTTLAPVTPAPTPAPVTTSRARPTRVPEYSYSLTTSSCPFDCNAGYHPCYSCLEKHWSSNKLNWCCTKRNVGCKANTPLQAYG